MQFILFLVVLLSFNKKTFSSDYVTFDNKNVNSYILAPQTLISSSSQVTKDNCSTLCDLVPNCFTFVFSSSNKENCFLFNKYFDPTELITSRNATMYEKNSNYVSFCILLPALIFIFSKAKSFVYAFHTFTQQLTIDTFPQENFTFEFDWLSSFSSVVNVNQTINYVLDVDNSKIVVFGDSWEYLGFNKFTRPVTLITTVDIFYIAGLYNLYKTDNMFNITKTYIPDRSYSPGGMISYRGLYLSQITNSLFAIADTQTLVFQFDLDLNPLDSFDISPYKPRSINGINNLVYIGTRDGAVLVIDDQTIIKTFNGCHGESDIITSMAFDNYGYLVTACESLKSAFIYSNDSYVGKSLNFNSLLEFTNFDANGQLIFLSAYGINILA